jgi:hypothetical protein
MKGKVNCTCGWSWNKSDSSKKDMYVCHECGRDNSNNMKNGGWLDNYGTKENPNDSSVSLPEGFVGMGNNTKGRDYSPAWGGQFEDGGFIPMAQKGYQTSKDSVAHQANKILKYEQLRGGPGGIPLPQYADPQYMDMLMNKVYPEVKKIMPKSSAMEIGEAMDFIFNAGWDKANNKITKDPRAFALQEYYRQYDPSKLDKDGKWSGRKNAPYSFDQEYANTIGKLPENQRRLLMNKGRDWYYKNINNPAPGVPSSDYNDTWYGRIWNTNDYNPFNPNNPKFTPKKQMGGYVYPVNYVPQAQDGEIIPSDLPDPVNGIIYNPEGERTYYDSRLDRIVLTPSSNFSPRQSVINHEKFHKYQFDNLGSNYEITHQGAVPLFNKPSMVSTDEEYYKFHNRKGREAQQDIENVKSNYPEFKFVPNDILFDKLIDRAQYSNPYTLEGEAQAYENSLNKYQMGGSIPGAVGFTYARTNSPAPSNGKYAKKTMPSAQEGRTITIDEGDEKKRKILTDSSEYAKLYNEGRIGVQNDDDESISFNPLNEVVVTPYDKQYPFYQELSDEEKKYFNSDTPIGRQLRSRAQDNVGFNADKATDFAMGWLRDLPLASLQAPQSALVEGVEAIRGNDFNMLNALDPSTQRIPSETWDIENPYAAFAVDALTDPETLMGMSLLKNPLQKGIKQLGNIPTSISPELRQGVRNNRFLDTFKNKPNFQLGINTMEDLPPLPEDLLTKLKKLQESSKAIDMVKQDLADPETIRRAEALGVNPEIFAEASKNMTYSSSIDVPSSYSSSDLEININPNQFGRTPEEAIMSGVMNSHSPNFTANEIGAHELGHFFQDTNYWKEAYPKTLDGLNRKLAQGMKGTPEGQKFLEYHPNYSTRDTAPTKVDQMLKDLEIRTGLDKEYYPQKNKNYFVDANKQYGTDVDNMIEKFPMFREYRQGMRDSGILKNKWDEITPEHIEDFRKLKPENRLNSFMEFNDKNYKLLNEVSKIAPAVLPIGLGLGAASQIEQKREGGIIKDDRGQWEHPGEITEINSPYITMKGVPYPVLGISDTGDTQMMYPEEEYEFDGTKVTEFPMAKNGLRQEQKGLVNLDNLLNFTNYNTKQPGGWLDKY